MKKEELKEIEELAEAALDFDDSDFGKDIKRLAEGFLYLYKEKPLQKILRITDEG